MAVLQDLLAPSVVTGIVSRIRTPGNPLQKYFNMGIGGSNVTQVSGRAYSWDIFDNVRSISKGRAPGTGPASTALNPVGRQTQTFPRSYEKIPNLSYELLHNIRTLGKNAGQKDRMGMAYVENQLRQLKLRQEHWREYQLAMLLTAGKQFYAISGDDWIPKAASATPGWEIDYRIPAGNKSTAVPGLDPLGTGAIIDASWATASTNIPLHLHSINRAFQQLVGEPLALAVTDSLVWNHILNNTKLQAQGGSVNSVFAEYTRNDMVGPDGNSLGVFVCKLRAIPWLDWLIVDTGLDIDGTYTPWYGGTKVTFMINPDPSWLKMVEGSEPVKDNPMAEAVERFGVWSWLREWDEPARIELHSLQNSIVEVNVPKGIMIATVA